MCSQKHCTILHIDTKDVALSSVLSENNKQAIISVLVKEEGVSCGYIGAGKVAVVPVKVKSTVSNQSVEINAFLDPGCLVTFCNGEPMRDLTLTGRKTNILLRTMWLERSYFVFGIYSCSTF